ncbi:MAG: thioredoxin [Blastocatellia bacterium]|nr:thioredoxin [Blastocatellia bacterium]
MSGNVVEITDGNFEKVVSTGQPVLVDCWAAWCAPCRMLSPTIEALANDYEGRAVIGKLNVDENSATSAKFGIKGIPTLILFKDGGEKERIVGATAKENIARMIDKYM